MDSLGSVLQAETCKLPQERGLKLKNPRSVKSEGLQRNDTVTDLRLQTVLGLLAFASIISPCGDDPNQGHEGSKRGYHEPRADAPRLYFDAYYYFRNRRPAAVNSIFGAKVGFRPEPFGQIRLAAIIVVGATSPSRAKPGAHGGVHKFDGRH
jgi:hypothetical protein